jgi:TRAP-type uncharacterized transport system substrate-binding protein
VNFVYGAVALALSLAITGCSESPVTLRIVSGPPAANKEVAALLASASDAVDTPVRLVAGQSVEGAEAALAALDEGTADLAIVENSSSFRDSNVRTVAPLYPSVLHIGVRPDKRGQSLRDVFDGATVFAGDEHSAARELLNSMASIYSWTGVAFSFVDSLDSGPDVVFVFAPISPSAAPILDGYELLSLGRAEDVGRGSLADGISLVAPLLRPFVIPEGTYGQLTPTAVATVAIDTLLVTRADIPRVVIYDLAEAIQMLGPRLFVERPDLAIDELEQFDISHLTFPVHAGALAFRARNNPGFFERASGILEVVVSFVVALGTALVALLRTWRARKKSRIDKFYDEALAIRAKFSLELTTQQRIECVTQLRALRDHAFSLLIDEKLAADESFQILQILIHNVILEFETASGPTGT